MDEILKRDQNRITVLGGVTNDASMDITMLRVDSVSKRLLVKGVISGSGTLTRITLTVVGAVDGQHNVFTAVSKPKVIVSDGIEYEEDDYNGNTLWTYNSGTITTAFYPQWGIYGYTY